MAELLSINRSDSLNGVSLTITRIFPVMMPMLLVKTVINCREVHTNMQYINISNVGSKNKVCIKKITDTWK